MEGRQHYYMNVSDVICFDILVSAMKAENQSFGTDFLLVGLFQYGWTNSLLFVVVATIFTVALTGNIMLIHLLRLDTRLHTPMYFLLSQLSIIDLMYISTTVPKMVVNFLSQSKTITFMGCEIQTCVFLALGGTEALLLGFMSYDRYVAICHPLHYPVLMSKKICLMVACAWASGSINAFVHTMYVFQLPFCRSRLINHFFCEIPALMSLVCQDTSHYEYTVLLSGLIILLLPFLAILASYAHVLIVVFQMSSGKGQAKAVSTCSSHLLVASLFYATTLATYTKPHSLRSPSQDKAVAVFYTIITPLLNPFIYSLRNKEVMGAMRRLLG
ncbi:olfactory receptor 2AK2 [Trachypithecus francoisi]|uniref:olfactory receptor 2AK2 n=1 Tax=Trachypithecus francoisi TaxID=54180 RepID=UPI00141AB983|nr:olfactory receptor 2AK2 [Trachypithecus francoisi]